MEACGAGCLGMSATPLHSMDVVAGLVKEIREAVQTVRRNKEDCELLAERADIILDLLRRVQRSDLIADPDTWKPTERLRLTLDKGFKLVDSCQERSCLYRLCRRGHIDNELRKVLNDLEFCVAYLTALITLINHDQITHYFPIQQLIVHDVQLQEGAQATVGLPVHNIEHNDCNDRRQTESNSGIAQLVTEPSIANECHLPGALTLSAHLQNAQNRRSGCCWRCPWKGTATASNAGLQKFTFSQLKGATNNFSLENQIGVGAFSTVYKGLLNEELEVAVKRASYVDKIPFHQLENELYLIPKLRHTNIVKLLGYCTQKRERILVFEYMPNKSLDAFITGQRATEMPLDWPKRSQIVQGIAEGVVYLHKQCEQHIIHGDLKPGNILLDAAMKPKICDFGASKALRLAQDKDCIGVVVGSRGYMAPEYKQGGCVSLKTDVYSFGAMLLEIIRGSRIPPSTLELSDESRVYGPLNKWAWDVWRAGNLMEFIDPSLHGETHAVAEIQRWVQIALLCAQHSPEERPDMWDVVLMLSSDSVILPKPKLPAYY